MSAGKMIYSYSMNKTGIRLSGLAGGDSWPGGMNGGQVLHTSTHDCIMTSWEASGEPRGRGASEESEGEGAGSIRPDLAVRHRGPQQGSLWTRQAASERVPARAKNAA